MHTYDKLWNCDCLYERNLEPEHLYLSRHVGLKGNLNLVTDYIVCSSFTRKAPLGAFLQGIVTVNAIYILYHIFQQLIFFAHFYSSPFSIVSYYLSIP